MITFTCIPTDSVLNEDLFGPITQCFVFARNIVGEYCIVRDKDEDLWSVPGGGRESYDVDALACIERELMEEAQLVGSNYQIFCIIHVEHFDNQGAKAKQEQHVRFYCDLDIIPDFVPQKDGFETVERSFVSLDELPSCVKLLQNDNGPKIIKLLKSLLI